jgi:hypothetical protein
VAAVPAGEATRLLPRRAATATQSAESVAEPRRNRRAFDHLEDLRSMQQWLHASRA